MFNKIKKHLKHSKKNKYAEDARATLRIEIEDIKIEHDQLLVKNKNGECFLPEIAACSTAACSSIPICATCLTGAGLTACTSFGCAGPALAGCGAFGCIGTTLSECTGLAAAATCCAGCTGLASAATGVASLAVGAIGTGLTATATACTRCVGLFILCLLVSYFF
jgi:hypothetical protein